MQHCTATATSKFSFKSKWYQFQACSSWLLNSILRNKHPRVPTSYICESSFYSLHKENQQQPPKLGRSSRSLCVVRADSGTGLCRKRQMAVVDQIWPKGVPVTSTSQLAQCQRPLSMTSQLLVICGQGSIVDHCSATENGDMYTMYF